MMAFFIVTTMKTSDLTNYFLGDVLDEMSPVHA
jgi:hypothetical protein